MCLEPALLHVVEDADHVRQARDGHVLEVARQLGERARRRPAHHRGRAHGVHVGAELLALHRVARGGEHRVVDPGYAHRTVEHAAAALGRLVDGDGLGLAGRDVDRGDLVLSEPELARVAPLDLASRDLARRHHADELLEQLRIRDLEEANDHRAGDGDDRTRTVPLLDVVGDRQRRQPQVHAEVPDSVEADREQAVHDVLRADLLGELPEEHRRRHGHLEGEVGEVGQRARCRPYGSRGAHRQARTAVDAELVDRPRLALAHPDRLGGARPHARHAAGAVALADQEAVRVLSQDRRA